MLFSRDNFSKISDGSYALNLDYKQSERTHWFSLFIDKNTALDFDSYGIEYIPQELLSKIKYESIITKVLG